MVARQFEQEPEAVGNAAAQAMRNAGGHFENVVDVVEMARERKEEDKIKQREELRALEEARQATKEHLANSEKYEYSKCEDDYEDPVDKFTKKFCMYADG